MAAWLLFGASVLIYAVSVHPAKILLYPGLGKSHILGLSKIGQELSTRNHEVSILVSSADKVKRFDGINYKIYKVPYGEDFLEKELVSKVIKGGVKESLFGNTSSPVVLGVYCQSLLDDKNLLDSVKDYDLIIADGTFYCGPLLAGRLGIRRVDYFPGSPRMPYIFSPYDTILTLSYLPQFLSHNPTEMNFFQRLKNVLVYWSLKAINRFLFYPILMDIKEKYNIQPEKTLQELFEDKELTFFITDFAVEHPQPLRPDYKVIGPMTVHPVHPLPPDIQQLIDSSGDDGAIIVSFGSNVASVLDKEKVDTMAEAFGRLRQKVIWRQQGYKPQPISDNIILRDWIPQNELLAHPKVRAFVSHVGMNGMYEALYHGVPLVAVPLYADQFDNAIRVTEKGVALTIDYTNVTADELYDGIQRVLSQPSFRENSQRISRLMKDRPRSPVQEAGDWVEYTLRHDSLAHLRPYSSQLTWYQYFLVDVAVFLVMVVVMVIMVIKFTVRLMCWMCCRRQNKQKTE